MPRGRPLEGAPGWRVIERPRRRPWRAGYVIVPLAACAGLFLALVPFHRDVFAWLEDQGLETSSSRLLEARESALLDAAKSEVLETMASRKAALARDVPKDTPDAERFEPQPTRLGRSIAYDLQGEDAPLPKPKPLGLEGAGGLAGTGGLQGAGAADERSAAPAAAVASPMRVFIQHTEGAADAAMAARLAAFLQDRGFTVAAIRSVDFRIDLPSVRYFFGPDQAGSRRLIDAIKGFFAKAPQQAPDQATDFTRFSPKPRQGSVEIWLPSRPAGWTRSAQAGPPS